MLLYIVLHVSASDSNKYYYYYYKLWKSKILTRAYFG